MPEQSPQFQPRRLWLWGIGIGLVLAIVLTVLRLTSKQKTSLPEPRTITEALSPTRPTAANA
ncbi:MAG: hypothetical protein V3S24_04030, partial [Candidatus Tectomicrobia bacterium]